MPPVECRQKPTSSEFNAVKSLQSKEVNFINSGFLPTHKVTSYSLFFIQMCFRTPDQIVLYILKDNGYQSACRPLNWKKKKVYAAHEKQRAEHSVVQIDFPEGIT